MESAKSVVLKCVKYVAVTALFTVFSIAGPRTLHVGPRAEYKTPCQAFKDARDGDAIEIDAAVNYSGDVCRISANSLIIRGVNGRAHIDAAGRSSEGKAIWVIGGKNTVIENIELSGCRVPDRNGAGIRQEGAGLILRNCYFHDNENGILTGANPSSIILFENSEFSHNGRDDGQTHNIYIGHIKKFTMKFCYSHQSPGGQLVKSRAAENQILYNRLSDEEGSNYEVDLSNAGLAFVIGNILQQSPTATNSHLLAFGPEGPIPDSRLVVVNNTFVNDRHAGEFITLHKLVTTPALIINNIFSGPGRACSQANAYMFGNLVGKDPMFRDRSHYSYQLSLGSPCIDTGTDLAKLGIRTLFPKYEYVHPCKMQPREIVGTIDIGAYEFARSN